MCIRDSLNVATSINILPSNPLRPTIAFSRSAASAILFLAVRIAIAGFEEGEGKMPVDVAEAGAPSRVEREEEAEMEAEAVEEGEYWGNGVTGPSWERREEKTGSRVSRSIAVMGRGD